MNDLFKRFSEVREHTAEDTLTVVSALLNATQKLVSLNLDTAHAVLEGGTLGLSTLLQAANPAQIAATSSGAIVPAEPNRCAMSRAIETSWKSARSVKPVATSR